MVDESKPQVFLKHVLIERFGMLDQVAIGPFAPGLNVVVGPGGGGRSIIGSFLEGILFGWPSVPLMTPGAPAGLQGEGRLVFVDGDGAETIVNGRDASGSAPAVAGDIDAYAYATAFRIHDSAFPQLDDATRLDVLLRHAAAGASEMPSRVMAALDGRVATITAPPALSPHSIPALTAELDEVEAQLRQVREHVRDRIAQYQAAREGSGEGPLEESLSAESKRFAALKQKRMTLRCELKDRRRELARLLLARRNMAAAMESWDEGMAAQVHRMAGLLLEDMTSGAWLQLQNGRDGRLWLQDAQGELRDPLLEPSGVRQQMYLAMRFAVLMAAKDVGAATPVLVDDVTAMLQPEVRGSALQALDSLARMRQVLLFASDESPIALLNASGIRANVVRL